MQSLTGKVIISGSRALTNRLASVCVLFYAFCFCIERKRKEVIFMRCGFVFGFAGDAVPAVASLRIGRRLCW